MYGAPGVLLVYDETGGWGGGCVTSRLITEVISGSGAGVGVEVVVNGVCVAAGVVAGSCIGGVRVGKGVGAGVGVPVFVISAVPEVLAGVGGGIV